MSEIKVGEYVRNADGYIEKMDSCDRLTNIYKDEDGKLRKWEGEDAFGNEYSSLIVKHSKNIIDLIEYGDVLEIFVNDNDIQKIVVYGDELYSLKIGELIAEDIKSIVTHEQFQSLEYRLGE